MSKPIRQTGFLLLLIYLSACTPISQRLHLPDWFTPDFPPPPPKTYPAQPLPRGWQVNDQITLPWGTSLDSVMAFLPDSIPTLQYWEEIIDTPSGKNIPLQKVRILTAESSPLMTNVTELFFTNIDMIYNLQQVETKHYQLSKLVHSLTLKQTGFPQLHAKDVLRHKILIEYGEPLRYRLRTYTFQDSLTLMQVRTLNKMRLKKTLRSIQMGHKLNQALEDVYSDEAIKQQKQSLLDRIPF